VNGRIVRIRAHPIVRAVALTVAAVATVGLLSSFACAQTLTDPTPQAKWSPPPAVQSDAKAKPAGRLKTCSAYGAGFVNLPGTDTCVKVGGWVTVEGASSR